jgi:predicted nucleic acid-binding protein
MKYILDTNSVIYFLDGALSPNGFSFVLGALQGNACALSVITEIETLGFQFLNQSQEKKAEEFIATLPIIQLTGDIVGKTIEIRKTRKIKVADAIIAATAILNYLTLVSRNEKDFKNIPGLNFLNPFDFNHRTTVTAPLTSLPAPFST